MEKERKLHFTGIVITGVDRELLVKGQETPFFSSHLGYEPGFWALSITIHSNRKDFIWNPASACPNVQT
jgi:hypothetical protein